MRGNDAMVFVHTIGVLRRGAPGRGGWVCAAGARTRPRRSTGAPTRLREPGITHRRFPRRSRIGSTRASISPSRSTPRLDEDGRACSSATTGSARSSTLRLRRDALHAGSTGCPPRSPCVPSRAGTGDRHRSLIPRHAGLRRGEESALHRALQAARCGGQLALPHRRPAVDRSPDEGRGLPLRLGRADPAVRAPDRRDRADPEAVSRSILRHRMRPPRPALRAHRASSGKVGCAPTRCCCAITTTRRRRYGLVIMRAIRIAGAATVLALGTFIFVMVRREGPGGTPERTAAVKPPRT